MPLHTDEPLHVFWTGDQPLTVEDRTALHTYGQLFSNAEKYLWVQSTAYHSRDDLTARNHREGLERETTDVGRAAGFQGLVIRDNLGRFAGASGKWSEPDLRNLSGMFLANSHPIWLKDLASYGALSTIGGTVADLSMRPAAGSGQAAPDADPHADWKVPMLDGGNIRSFDVPGHEAMSTHVIPTAEGARAEYDADDMQVPRCDCFIMYARPGSAGQQVFQGAFDKYVSMAAHAVNEGVIHAERARQNGDQYSDPRGVVVAGRLRPTWIGPESALYEMTSPNHPQRADIHGKAMMNSLYDSIISTHGAAMPDLPNNRDTALRTFFMDMKVWDQHTWPTERTSRGWVIPELGLAKEHRNTWRHPDAAARSMADVSQMRSFAPDANPGGWQQPPPGTDTQSSPAASVYHTPGSRGRRSPASQ